MTELTATSLNVPEKKQPSPVPSSSPPSQRGSNEAFTLRLVATLWEIVAPPVTAPRDLALKALDGRGLEKKAVARRDQAKRDPLKGGTTTVRRVLVPTGKDLLKDPAFDDAVTPSRPASPACLSFPPTHRSSASQRRETPCRASGGLPARTR